MRPITRMWACLLVSSSTVNGRELGAQEWRDSLFLNYGIEPTDLPDHFNGCGASFSIYHALECKNGFLTTAPTNELRDKVTDLARNAFTPTNVCG